MFTNSCHSGVFLLCKPGNRSGTRFRISSFLQHLNFPSAVDVRKKSFFLTIFVALRQVVFVFEFPHYQLLFCGQIWFPLTCKQIEIHLLQTINIQNRKNIPSLSPLFLPLFWEVFDTIPDNIWWLTHSPDRHVGWISLSKLQSLIYDNFCASVSRQKSWRIIPFIFVFWMTSQYCSQIYWGGWGYW